LIFVLAVFLAGAAGANATPVKTLVQDVLYRADGSAAQGDVTIRWSGFSTSAGEAVAAGEMTVQTDANGGIAVSLIPNTGASPAGSYYRVVITLNDGTTSEEVWVVPVAATTTIATIRAKVVPQAVAAQWVSRDYVDSALANVVHLSGAETIAGVKTFVPSPVVPMATVAGGAANKEYIDQAVDGLATVASTGNYNDLLNKPASLASPGAIGSTTPGPGSFTTVCNWEGPVDAKACFGAKGDGVTSDVAAIQAWLSYLAAGNMRGVLPPGTYNVSNYSGLATQSIEGVSGYVLALQNAANVTIEGHGATLVQSNAGSNSVALGVYNCPNFHMYGVTLDGQNVYTSASSLVYVQQLMHVIDSDGFVLEGNRFRRAFGNGLVVTHQYSNSVTARVVGENAGRITNNLFEQVNTGIETAYRGVGQLEIAGNQFRNNTLGSVKLSSGPGVTSATSGYNTALTNVLVANNVVKYDSNYANPMNSNGVGQNQYLYGFDSASNMKQITYSGNTLDFAGYGPSGMGGIKINWDNGDLEPASDGNLAPEKVTIIGNQILNLPTGSFGVVLTPTMRNLLMTGNRIASAHTGVIVETLGQNIGSWDGKSTWQFDGNQFIDNDQADINIIGLNASRVAVKNNTFSLQTVSSGLQALSIDSASTIGELTIAGNGSDKTIVSAAASTTVNAIGNTVNAQSGTQPLSIYPPSITTGSELNLQNNTLTGGADSYFANFATANVGSGNTWSNQTNAGGAVYFNNITALSIDKPQFVNPAGTYLVFAGTTSACGSLMGPLTSFSSLVMCNGSTAERTDGAGIVDQYVYESGAWEQAGQTLPGTPATPSNLGGSAYVQNGTQNTVNTLLTTGFSHTNLNNRQINVQQILNATTANQVIMLNGTLGSTSAVGTPTCTSYVAPCFGIASDDSQLYYLTGPAGTNTAVTLTPFSSFTAMGNAFNGNSQLVETNSSGLIPTSVVPTLNQNTTGTAGGLSANIAESQVTNLIGDLAGKQAALTNPVTGPGSAATVGHMAVMGNTAGTAITDGGAVPTRASLGDAASGANSDITSLNMATGASNNVKVGPDTANATYNILSLNGSLTDTTAAGLMAGGSGDNNLYVDAGSGGAVYFRQGSTTKAIIGGGSPTTLVCWKADGKTLGYATMSAGNITACN
jgi:hypothetical protein